MAGWFRLGAHLGERPSTRNFPRQPVPSPCCNIGNHSSEPPGEQHHLLRTRSARASTMRSRPCSTAPAPAKWRLSGSNISAPSEKNSELLLALVEQGGVGRWSISGISRHGSRTSPSGSPGCSGQSRRSSTSRLRRRLGGGSNPSRFSSSKAAPRRSNTPACESHKVLASPLRGRLGSKNRLTPRPLHSSGRSGGGWSPRRRRCRCCSPPGSAPSCAGGGR